MLQPAGRVCGYDLALRTYLRSSPIVCVCDALMILVRFALYYRNVRCPLLAAKLVMAARRQPSRGERTGEAIELGDTIESSGAIEATDAPGFQHLEASGFLRWFIFVLGVLPQTIKLLACKGLPWTTTWGLLYLSAFFASEMVELLARFSTNNGPGPTLRVENVKHWDDKLRGIERACGAIAIFLQLGVLALVDLRVFRPDEIAHRTWEFRVVRLIAHFVTIFIYLPSVLSQHDDPARALQRRSQSVAFSTFCVFVAITVMHGFNLNYRFSQMYYLWSLIISIFAWMLHFFESTRKHILLCRDRGLGIKNVLAFDFCLRIIVFGVYWYVWHYNANGTSKPRWAEYLG